MYQITERPAVRREVHCTEHWWRSRKGIKRHDKIVKGTDLYRGHLKGLMCTRKTAR
jgi:hypothetical protein